MTTVLDQIRCERRETYLTGYQEIVYIRVTRDAIPGSVTSTLIAPERLRLLAASLIRGKDDVLVADPDAQERWREIVIHPLDWADLHRDLEAARTGAITPTSIMGIPIRVPSDGSR